MFTRDVEGSEPPRFFHMTCVDPGGRGTVDFLEDIVVPLAFRALACVDKRCTLAANRTVRSSALERRSVSCDQISFNAIRLVTTRRSLTVEDSDFG